MSKPTEPGYYWLQRHGEWEIVKVEEGAFEAEGQLLVYFYGWGQEGHVKNYTDDQWGGKITQEPAPDPPPPF